MLTLRAVSNYRKTRTCHYAIVALLFRVATAQGKQGIWFLLFPGRENTGNFVLTQGKYFLAQIWTQWTLRHILGPILIIFEICQFLAIPGPFEYFSENGWSQKIKVFSMKERSLPPYQFSFRRRGP